MSIDIYHDNECRRWHEVATDSPRNKMSTKQTLSSMRRTKLSTVGRVYRVHVDPSPTSDHPHLTKFILREIDVYVTNRVVSMVFGWNFPPAPDGVDYVHNLFSVLWNNDYAIREGRMRSM